jgi:hypothetical protein
MMKILNHVRLTLCALTLLAPPIFGQSDNAVHDNKPIQAPPANDAAEPDTPRFYIGARFDFFPQRLFQTPYTTASSVNPILSYAYLGSSSGSRYWLGLTGEYRLHGNLWLGVDFFHHQAEYTQVTQIKSGTQDPNSSYDNRQVTTVSEDTRAAYWDVPFVVRYYGLYHSGRRGLGWTKQTYALGGAAYRHVGNVRTGTSTSNADSSTTYDETPAKALHTNLAGVVAGVGFKVFEYGKFKSMFEGRYTRWSGFTFEGPAYGSQRNQFDLGLSFAY